MSEKFKENIPPENTPTPKQPKLPETTKAKVSFLTPKKQDPIAWLHNQDVHLGDKKIGELKYTDSAELKGMESENVAILGNIKIEPELRGKGHGKAVYRQFIKEVQARGLQLRSGDTLSREAQRVWESLVRSGEAEEIQPSHKNYNPNIPYFRSKLEPIVAEKASISPSEMATREEKPTVTLHVSSEPGPNPTLQYSDIFIGNKKIGELSYKEYEGAIMFGDIKIDKDFRKMGYGREAYRQLIKLAQSRGLQLQSGDVRSEDAKRVWKSLVRSGEAEPFQPTHKSQNPYIPDYFRSKSLAPDSHPSRAVMEEGESTFDSENDGDG